MPEFFEVPGNIREHLISPRTSAIIDNIQEKAEIYRVGILSDLVSRLVMRDILPQDFRAKLEEEVGVSEKKAQVISRELKEKVLEPIRYALVNWGVDINQIDVAGAPTLDEFLKEREAAEADREKFLTSLGIEMEKGEEAPATTKETGQGAITFESLGAMPTQEEAVTIRPMEHAADREKSDEVQPLIIHRESPMPTARESFGSKSFSLPFGFFKKAENEITKSVAPVVAKVEGLKEEKRVVHYSESRTPLTPFNKKDEFINTTPFDAQKNAAPASDVKAPTAPVASGFFPGTHPATAIPPTSTTPAPQKIQTPTTPKIPATKPKPMPMPLPVRTSERPNSVPDLSTGKKSWGFILKNTASETKAPHPENAVMAAATGAPKMNPPATPQIKAPNAMPFSGATTPRTPSAPLPIGGGMGDVVKSGGGIFKLPSKPPVGTPPREEKKTENLTTFFSDIKKDIDLDKARAASQAVEKKPASGKQEPGPHVEGNTVDLR